MTLPRWASSLKTRLTTLFFVALLLVLFVGGQVILHDQEQSLLDSLETSLIARADDIVALMEQDQLPETLGMSRDEDSVAVIIDNDGATISTTDGFGDPAELRSPSGWTGHGWTVSASSFAATDGSESLRVVALAGPNGETVYVGQSLQRVTTNLAELERLLVQVGLSLTIVGGILCWLVVWRAIGPVDLMVAQASQISSTSLDHRLIEPGRQDEIQALASTLNEMLARLERSARQQRQLVGDVAHELRSPLTGIATLLDVDLTHPATADWQDTATQALDETRRLQSLIDDLLLLANLDDAEARTRHQLVDLDQVVLDGVTRLGRTTEVPIDQSAVSAGLVRGSKSQLERVVHNLLDNAVRHATSQVTVALAERSGWVQLTVADDGEGVPPDQRMQVFQRFHRTQHARDRHSGGTGLGLAIVAETVAAHGGTISVSEAEPRGALFTLLLPEAGD